MKRIVAFIVLVLFGLSSCAMAQRHGEDVVFSDIPKIIRTASPSIVMIKVFNDKSENNFIGSGFFIAWRGRVYIASAGHLTEKNVEKIQLLYQAVWINKDGEEVIFPIEAVFVRFKNRSEDFVIFSFDVGKLPFSPTPLKFGDSNKLLSGDWAISIGAPSAILPVYTVGNVAHFKFGIFILHSALISRGSSGGPLIDLNGRVVGMNVAIIQDAVMVGIAITSNTMLEHLEEFDAENASK